MDDARYRTLARPIREMFAVDRELGLSRYPCIGMDDARYRTLARPGQAMFVMDYSLSQHQHSCVGTGDVRSGLLTLPATSIPERQDLKAPFLVLFLQPGYILHPLFSLISPENHRL